MDNNIGARIRKLRKENGYTINQLAEMLDISQSFMGLIERGTRVPGLNNLVNLCSVLGTTLDFIVLSVEEKAYQDNGYLFSQMKESERGFLWEIGKLITQNNFDDEALMILLEAVKFQIKQIKSMRK